MLGGRKYVSIEMGSQNIKVVTATAKKRSFTVDSAFIVPVPEGAYADGEIVDAEALRSSLISAFGVNSMSVKDAIVSINSTKVITRELFLPVTRPEEIEGMIHYEIQQYFPVELSQYVVEYKVTGEILDGDIRKNRIMVGTVPKRIVESYIDLLDSLGLRPAALDTCASAVANIMGPGCFINGETPTSGSTIALIDLGHSSMTVNILDDGLLKLSRIIDDGGEASVSGIMAHEEGMKEIIDAWIVKIQRIFQFYLSRGSVAGIESVYIYGGLSYMNGLAEHMQSVMGMRVSALESVSGFGVSGSVGKIDVRLFLNAVGAIGRG